VGIADKRRHALPEVGRTCPKCLTNFTGIAEWSVPRGGMFVWLKITVLEDVYDLAMNKCVSRNLYILPGHCFYPSSNEPCQYLRLAYSHSKPEDVEKVASASSYSRDTRPEKMAFKNIPLNVPLNIPYRARAFKSPPALDTAYMIMLMLASALFVNDSHRAD
jgi:hypothetical protein